VCVAEPRVDEAGEAGGLEVGERLTVTALVDLDGDEPLAGLAQGPGDPDARVARRRADLERAGIAVLHDEVVQQLAVARGHVQVAPASGAFLEELADACVERGLVVGLGGDVVGGCEQDGCRKEPGGRACE
jgi:hypothetical protein